MEVNPPHLGGRANSTPKREECLDQRCDAEARLPSTLTAGPAGERAVPLGGRAYREQRHHHDRHTDREARERIACIRKVIHHVPDDEREQRGEEHDHEESRPSTAK